MLLTLRGPRRSLRLNPKLPDDRPPFLSIGFLHDAEDFGRLSLAWKKLLSSTSRDRRMVEHIV